MTPNDTPLDDQPLRKGRRAIGVALGVALVGLALCVVGYLVDPRQAAAAYLIAYAFAVTVMLGLTCFVMASHAMHAEWPSAVRRLAEMGMGSMVVLVPLVAPLLLSLGLLYPWMHPERINDAHIRELVFHKQHVMNAVFVSARAIVFVLLWTAICELLRNGSLEMDTPSPPDRRGNLRTLSGLMLPVVGITGTMAAFDWLMSLSPDFYSTMYGFYVLSGGFVAAIGLLAVMMFFGQRAGHLFAVNTSHWYAIGRLLFAFLVFWAYTAFFQYLIIWIGNKPLEAKFYLERIQPGDRGTSWFIVFGCFVVPWLVLLSYRVKRKRATVTLLGAWLLLCHYVDIHWLVGAHRGAAPWQWQDLPALLFVGGTLVAFAIWRQRGHLLSACHDPDYAAGIAYESK
ncbi:MAG: hypothetical protein ABI321_03410 [Polyangia bacterium]